MDYLSLVFKVKVFTSDSSSTKYIKYDHDAGHAYSYIDHPIVSQVAEYPQLDDELNTWLSNNDECPPCSIHIDHINKKVYSGCGCHDYETYEEGLLIKEQLEQYCDENNMSTEYLITEEHPATHN